MAKISMTYYSQILKKDVPMTIIYPDIIGKTKEELQTTFKSPYPVLYLLHGLMVDHSAWTRFTMLEEYAKNLGLVIVMPEGDRSYYINHKKGPRYSHFITKELPEVIKNTFHVSSKRKNTFIAGMSMGGYGALHAALSHPEQYSVAGSFSGTLNIESVYDNTNHLMRKDELDTIFGEEDPKGTKNDLNYLIQRLDDENIVEMPDIYVTCGTEDSLYDSNEAFVDENIAKLSLVYEWENGDHDFAFWNMSINKFLDTLSL